MTCRAAKRSARKKKHEMTAQIVLDPPLHVAMAMAEGSPVQALVMVFPRYIYRYNIEERC